MAKEDKEYKYTSAKTTYKEKRNKGKTTLIQNNTYNTFEPPKEKRRINTKGIGAICLILLVMITLTFIIGGKTYKVEVLSNGHVHKSGEPPTTLMQVLQYAQSVPDVGLQDTLKTIVTTINGTNERVNWIKATDPNFSNFDKYMYSAFQIIISIIWLPIVFIVQIVAFIGWAVGAIFVL